jgi:hypothetical protein
MVAVAAFSLVGFYWALRVALPGDRIQQTIDASVVPEEPAIP